MPCPCFLPYLVLPVLAVVWAPGTGHTSCCSVAPVCGVCVLPQRRALGCMCVSHAMLRAAVLGPLVSRVFLGFMRACFGLPWCTVPSCSGRACHTRVFCAALTDFREGRRGKVWFLWRLRVRWAGWFVSSLAVTLVVYSDISIFCCACCGGLRILLPRHTPRCLC